MTIFLIALIIIASLIILILLLVFRYRSFLSKIKLTKRQKEKEKSLDGALEKYIGEESKGPMKQKLAKISEIIAKTEAHIEETVKKKIKVAKSQLKVKESEEVLISKAKMEYTALISDFKSAMPRTEQERVQDMKELKSAISMLETFDEESYEARPKEYDAGLGMFYEKISRRFLSIINENKLTEYGFIPIQRIKYHAFSTIKNIKDEDFIPVLKVMKETNLINNIVEINPQFQIIVFTDEIKLDLSIPEKVLLSFAYDEDLLTFQKLVELTEWKENHANSVIEGLKEKGIITIENDIITAENFGTIEERIEWNKTIQDIGRKEKFKEEKKRLRQLERAAQLKRKLAKKTDIEITDEPIYEPEKEEILKEIKFKEKPSVKDLVLLKEDAKITSEVIQQDQENEKKDVLTSVIEALDEIMPSDISTTNGSEHGEVETQDIQDLVAEEILNYHEKFSLINGGFSQYEKIKQYLDQELENVPEDLVKKMLEQLKKLELIFDSITIGYHDFYLFNDISLTEDDKDFIEFAINKKPMIKEDFIQGLNWNESRISITIKNLQDKNVLRMELGYIIIPGVIQNE